MCWEQLEELPFAQQGHLELLHQLSTNLAVDITLVASVLRTGYLCKKGNIKKKHQLILQIQCSALCLSSVGFCDGL